MSWIEFENMLPNHPRLYRRFQDIRPGLAELLRNEPRAVLDADYLGHWFELPEEDALDLLVLLAKEELVSVQLCWQCSNGRGTTLEATEPKEFPTFVACERCGEIHEYDEDCVSVQFLATPRLINSLAQ